MKPALFTAIRGIPASHARSDRRSVSSGGVSTTMMSVKGESGSEDEFRKAETVCMKVKSATRPTCYARSSGLQVALTCPCECAVTSSFISAR